MKYIFSSHFEHYIQFYDILINEFLKKTGLLSSSVKPEMNQKR